MVIPTSLGNGADAYIQSNPVNSNDNFGTAEEFFIKNDLGTGFLNRKGYLRFDLSSLPNAARSATVGLTFTFNSSSSFATNTYNVFGLIDGNAENWDERTITWNNAPANDGSPAGVNAGASLLNTFQFDNSALSPGDTVSFSFDELADFINADTDSQITLIISRQERSFGNEGFATQENLMFDTPTLTVSTVPIPPAVGLFGSAAVFLFGFARRRHRNIG